MAREFVAVAASLLLASSVSAQSANSNTRPRASDLGLKVGILPTGPLNAITDVAGVEVGHTTIISGDNVRTGVTAVLPHSGNLYRDKVPGAIFVGNGFGKLTGSTPVNEMGEIEKPIVQTNFGGVLSIAGAPVGQELGRYYLHNELQEGSRKDKADGSCMIVIATDAPIDPRNLRRFAARAWLGMARIGSAASNGSGDYAIAFSTAPQLRNHTSEKPPTRHAELLTNDAMSPLFLAVIEATEEAIYNSIFRATTMSGNGHTVEGLPIDKTIEILKEHRSIK